MVLSALDSDSQPFINVCSRAEITGAQERAYLHCTTPEGTEVAWGRATGWVKPPIGQRGKRRFFGVCGVSRHHSCNPSASAQIVFVNRSTVCLSVIASARNRFTVSSPHRRVRVSISRGGLLANRLHAE
jgi:hypothetical protein